jgi:ABC-type Fe3+-hydroxamate transport system substrate-binding protein
MHNRAMQRWGLAAALSMMILAACSSTSSSTSTPAATSPPSTSASASASGGCVNKTDFEAAVGDAETHVQSAVSAVTSLNFGTATEELQKAGDSVRSAADIAGDASPDVKAELQAAADSVDQAVTDLQNNNAAAAATDLAAAGASLTQAANTNANDFFC